MQFQVQSIPFPMISRSVSIEDSIDEDNILYLEKKASEAQKGLHSQVAILLGPDDEDIELEPGPSTTCCPSPRTFPDIPLSTSAPFPDFPAVTQTCPESPSPEVDKIAEPQLSFV